MPSSVEFSRRRALTTITSMGIGSAVFQRALATTVSQQRAISKEMIQQAEWVAGINLDDDQRNQLSESIDGVLRHQARIRSVPLEHQTIPSVVFDPTIGDPDAAIEALDRPEWLRVVTPAPAQPSPPASSNDLSFLSINELGQLLRSGSLSSS